MTTTCPGCGCLTDPADLTRCGACNRDACQGCVGTENGWCDTCTDIEEERR